MTLFVTNTLTGEREPFEPGDPDSVLLYYCGLTVSDFAHLGHARGWIHTDVMHRWLEHLGYDVHHVENFTDVNEKITARVGEDDLGDDEADVARTFITQVIRDMRDLNLKRADVYPRVSEHLPEITDLIETLVEKGYAYESNGSVYFDVTTFEDYGKLSNQRVEEMEAQGEGDERGEKRHPGDFALWKADGVSEGAVEEHRDPDTEYAVSHPSGQTWDSPWGEGRPGWHIECSAMSMEHLGETIDIHVGGQDLVFPHHENEIAQSEAATGHQFARYWLHVRLLETEGEKMSSSLGNYSTVRGAISEIGANAVRMFLLSTSYANRQTFSDETLNEAVERWDRLSDGYDRAVEALDGPDARTKVEDDELRQAVTETREEFADAMNDDFNTRRALAALLDLVTAVNRHADAHEEYDYDGLKSAVETFEELGGDVLGFSLGGEAGGDVRLAEDLVELVLDLREGERDAGNYDRADALRDDLQALGVDVQDSDSGPSFKLP
ncbi:cysteinyl-tRNA synthetase [Haladaptatus paucihalophilus DX253]|uniref:Cysteine--tRNA ligase n=1 Tax=Haladaptatus paucihalophilus DX253 TaxID=797209 RepID=E7QRZ9_HALPU|nr:cysteine--tRNA ligase [Haladaptatus paucihalophilus]EFW92768.1 cysteinyl-tRNA synthetase [Haladaptatus paucihalophilus DX253]SHK13146.1 cysteinyl-tRNA synthetase [Haladaptatus paucihalophilus DX253]